MADNIIYNVLGNGMEDDQKVVASNVTERIRHLHNILQFAPVESQRDLSDIPPSPAGVQRRICCYFFVQKNEGKWKRVWGEYHNRIFTQRPDEGSRKVISSYRVSFIERETFDTRRVGSPSSNSSRGSFSDPSDSHKYDDLYFSYLESSQATYAFKLFYPDGIDIFRADTEDMCAAFVSRVQHDLKVSMNESLWSEKVGALKEMNPLLREQLMLHLNRYNALARSLAKSGFMEDDLPITSTRKEKCGVLAMEIQGDFEDEMEWRDFYFVLFMGALFYYKDSKSTTPTGFVTLRYATVQIDQKALTKGEYVFLVRTPLRTVTCRTKHSVALSEWIACLENALSTHKPAPKALRHRSSSRRKSLEVLENINRMLADISTFQALLQNTNAVESFKKFVEQNEGNPADVDFCVRTEVFSVHPPRELTAGQCMHARSIYKEFFELESKEQDPVMLRKDVIEEMSKTLHTMAPSSVVFKTARTLVIDRLQEDFENFKDTDEYGSLEATLGARVVSDKREVEAFSDGLSQMFVLKVKGSKRSKEIPFKKKEKVLTIGRDKCNDLVIEDSRVSRSHARVEYHGTQCEYIDLGSSCGSKLNGKSVLRAKLQKGDVIEIGQSSLIFTLKKKKRFSLKAALSTRSLFG